MFDPLNFYRLAVKLVKRRPSEAESRTSATRAYYACFLTARTYTDQEGVRGPEVHHHVVIELHRMNRSDLATRLHALRDIRNEADYDTTRAFSAAEARKAVNAAASSIKALRRA